MDNPSELPCETPKIYRLIRNLLQSDTFMICYVDKNDQYQFVYGEMDTDEMLALAKMTNIEINMACENHIYSEE